MRLRYPSALVLVVVLFVGHQVTQYLGWHHSPLNNYLDPFCFLPIVLSAWLWEANRLRGALRFELSVVLIAGIFLSILAEEVAPRFNPHLIRDWWDYPAYLLGLAYFWFFLNPKEQ